MKNKLTIPKIIAWKLKRSGFDSDWLASSDGGIKSLRKSEPVQSLHSSIL